MNREKVSLIVIGSICIFGCAFIWVYNYIEANYAATEIIYSWEYSDAISLDESEKSEAGDSSVADGESATININTASAQQLADFLPGIGPSKAQAIVEYRETVGRFVSVNELLRVEGIGEKTLESIRPYCRLKD